jgi:hypothetical protein
MVSPLILTFHDLGVAVGWVFLLTLLLVKRSHHAEKAKLKELQVPTKERTLATTAPTWRGSLRAQSYTLITAEKYLHQIV